MRLSLKMDGSEPIGPDDVTAAERQLGFALPPHLVALCLHQNGGMPDRSWLISPDGMEEQVDCFLPIKPQSGADRRGIVDTYQQMTGEGLLPTMSVPFAQDAGGNLYLLDRVTGRVWFMPMDEWDRDETAAQNWSRSGRTVATSFQAFVDALTDDAPEWARD
ncbi:SMI1/KNR4 family protein SUKH-1 [Sphingomonas sp. PP-CE-3G-477]|uniref:SMI1/KNR4 family protein n=1 Tax=Sphingomonas sp. PP-CE-3G-477 TaxID=2135660 RepID=UPI000D36EAAE|nr:SMI1/KNR4 family protein [Sphingomonas sp. PP-CE-3G-477]PTQ58804.1 SMI1/KNR4 family protein SUKH-1 [Sphingomonas sp. PP-CE-3G-477]